MYNYVVTLLRLSPYVREAPDFTNFVGKRKEPNVDQDECRCNLRSSLFAL